MSNEQKQPAPPKETKDNIAPDVNREVHREPAEPPMRRFNRTAHQGQALYFNMVRGGFGGAGRGFGGGR